jgi:hypothetical protein
VRGTCLLNKQINTYINSINNITPAHKDNNTQFDEVKVCLLFPVVFIFFLSFRPSSFGSPFVTKHHQTTYLKSVITIYHVSAARILIENVRLYIMQHKWIVCRYPHKGWGGWLLYGWQAHCYRKFIEKIKTLCVHNK